MDVCSAVKTVFGSLENGTKSKCTEEGHGKSKVYDAVERRDQTFLFNIKVMGKFSLLATASTWILFREGIQ